MKQRVHDLIGANAPDSLAVVDHDGARYTYGQLEQIAVQMAQMLRAHGVRGGDRVVLLSENGMTYAAAILAISKIDAWIVPLNARVPVNDIEALLDHSGARCMICTVGASAAAAAHAAYYDAVTLGQLPCGDIVVTPVREVAVEPVEAGAGQVAALFYTSGTTGKPKGVMLTHANLTYAATAASGVRGTDANDQVLGVLPGTHVYGFGGILLPVWNAGASIRFLPAFVPEQVLEALQQEVTLFPAVPQMYAALLKVLRDKGVDQVKTDLKIISSGGSPLDPGWKAEIERIFGVHLHNGYGLTEASPSVAVTRVKDPRKDTSVGRVMDGQELLIHDPGTDGTGEIWVRGPNVMKGYYKDPQATAATITPDGFLKTGDLGRLDADGSLHIIGRCKELILHSGFNVYPAEVESVLNAHDAVVQSAVVGRARDGNEDVLAFLVAQDRVSPAELRAWMQEHMVSYKVPLHFIIVDALPQAATGKVLKSELLPRFARELKLMDAKNA
ncbi:class I adenylate-forming enzyme family protein [Loktanella agnita]|uniref:class I adenylate-forming enzyme family protein n=1 Tax=Loktanella agnita TaxID=287097 RepID=UPI00398790C4